MNEIISLLEHEVISLSLFSLSQDLALPTAFSDRVLESLPDVGSPPGVESLLFRGSA